jgi:hypothetical protein
VTTNDPTFNFEIIKLMLQAAFADLHLAPEEAELIMGRAEKLGLWPNQLAVVRSCLEGKRKLPPPDMGLLRLNRNEVLWTIRELFLVDTKFVPDEKEFMHEIEQLLG